VSVVETLAVYAVIPLAVISVVVGMIIGAAGRSRQRYRPGRPFSFAPVWFLSAQSGGSTSVTSSLAVLPATQARPEIESGPSRAALVGAEPPVAAAGGATSLGARSQTQNGGAHGSW